MKKLLSLLLLLAMLLGILALVACPAPNAGGGGGGGGETPPAGEPTDYADGLDTDTIRRELGGTTVTFSIFENYQYELYAEEGSRDALDEMVRKRNKKIEERFGITLAFDITAATGANDMGSHPTYVTNALRAGHPDFDVIAMMAYQSGRLIAGDDYLDLRKSVPSVRESLKAGDAWWPAEMNKSATVKGRQFVAVSDLSISGIDLAMGIVFNERLVNSYNVASTYGASRGKDYRTMYDIVRDGAWTLDAMIEMTKDRWVDNKEAGKIGSVDIEDTVGFYTLGYTEIDNFAWSSGFTYIQNDGVSDPEVWTLPPTFDTLLTKLRTYFNDAPGAVDATWLPDRTEATKKAFAGGRIMFMTADLRFLKDSSIAGMEDTHGVLPYPKFSDGQERYLTSVKDNVTVLSVPRYTVGKQRRATGAMVVALSAETTKSINKTYYEMILKHDSGMENRAAVEMIDLIMAGRVYELSIYHYDEFRFDREASYGTFGLFLRHLIMEAPSRDAGSMWAGVSDTVRGQMTDLIHIYETHR